MSNPPRRLVFVVAGALAVGGLGACSGAKAASQSPTSISVRELNIVDEHGQARIRIGAPLPDPQGLKRAVKAYGIQFMDPSGQEIGGLAMLDSIGIHGLCFDSKEGYEAMCMRTRPHRRGAHPWRTAKRHAWERSSRMRPAGAWLVPGAMSRHRPASPPAPAFQGDVT